MMFGRKQWIVIGGGLVILGSGLGALAFLDLDAAKAFLDFAGSFGWKVIVGATGSAAVATVGKAIKGS
jgi:hypothetical protein